MGAASQAGRCVVGSPPAWAFGTRPWEPNPSLERTLSGKAPWPRSGAGLSSASRPRRLASAVRSAQTLGPHGHSAGHAQESRGHGATANKNASAASPRPAALGSLQRRSAPASRSGENVSQSHGSSPANPSAKLRAVGTSARLRPMAGLSHVRLTAPTRSPVRASSVQESTARRTTGGPVCQRFVARLGLRLQAVGA
jgi:hypothetical protein